MIEQQLSALAAHLRQNREQILRSWRELIHEDPELTTASSMPRAQLNDHIPAVLDAFERRLHAAEDALRATQATVEQRENAAEHGLQRWQQGYGLRETIREWGHLQLCLLRRLDEYAQANAAVSDSVMRIAREALIQLCGEGVCESAARHARLRQQEAATRTRELEHALAQLQQLERQRGELLLEAAHDLRSSVGVISHASVALARSDVRDEARHGLHELLERSARSLIGEVIELGRLEAAQDPVQLTAFDAAVAIRELCEPLRALAAQRNLFFRTEGPSALPVEGDPVKLQRIVQNLVLNALEATEHGGVQVRWESEPATAEPARWLLWVQDTGPGLDPRHASSIGALLKHATDEAHAVDAAASGAAEPLPTLGSASEQPTSARVVDREGVGLSIVKRLCELLDASLELETAPHRGTTVRVSLPRQYRRRAARIPAED